MKAYQLALFFLLFQVSAAIIEYAQVFPDNVITYDHNSLTGWEQKARDAGISTAGEQNADQNAELMQSKGFFSDIVNVLNPANTFSNLGVPPTLSILLAVPIWFVWFAALIQFIRGSSFTSQA